MVDGSSRFITICMQLNEKVRCGIQVRLEACTHQLTVSPTNSYIEVFLA
jgi:hypothetical protein